MNAPQKCRKAAVKEFCDACIYEENCKGALRLVYRYLGWLISLWSLFRLTEIYFVKNRPEIEKGE